MRAKHPSDDLGARAIAQNAGAQFRPPRRNFLLALGLGGAGAAAATAGALGGPAMPEPAQAASPDGKGYELTEHVRRYYRTAKI